MAQHASDKTSVSVRWSSWIREGSTCWTADSGGQGFLRADDSRRSGLLTVLRCVVMALPGCVFQRSLPRSREPPHRVVIRDVLELVALWRYTRDRGSSVCFPQAVLSGQDLFDATLSDGDCRLQVTLDPGLTPLVDRHVLRPGCSLRNATLAQAMCAQPPGHPGSAAGQSFILLTVEVMGGAEEEEEQAVPRPDVQALPWFGSSEPGVPVPLRAYRSVFLPLWNNVDYSGEQWREAPPTEEEEDSPEPGPSARPASTCPPSGARVRPGVTVAELRDSFLARQPGFVRGTIRRRLVVRVTRKSHLMYFGHSGQNCACPYKAVLEVCDATGSISVVLWNSVGLGWYRCLRPGALISLSSFRLKQHYQEPEDVEISVNSRNPAARICLLPPSSVAPENLPPPVTYCFHSSQELLDQPHGTVCDVIGLLTFLGRSERTRSKGGQGAELLEYRWLQLEDGTSERPIWVKLFPTSQPDTQRKLCPLSLVVCCGVKLLRAADGGERCVHVTNTIYTQLYCSGLGQHWEMDYRGLRPVKRFLRWVRSLEDGPVLSRARVGGFFMYPPPPVSLEAYMRGCRGDPGFLRGLELQRELDKLRYRERRTFCVQATVAMVTHSLRGQEDRCLSWTLHSLPFRFADTPPPAPPSAATPSSSSASSSGALRRRLSQQHRNAAKRRRVLPDSTSRRCPGVTDQPEPRSTAILFTSSMELLHSEEEEEEEAPEDEDAPPTAPLPPVLRPIATETLPLCYHHAQREELAAAVALGGRVSASSDFMVEDYYTFRLRALTDGVLVDATFLPHSSGSSHQHANTWTSILAHGAFSSDTAPPAPGDLIQAAAQLANQKLLCVLEACHLGGAKIEVVLSRAFFL